MDFDFESVFYYALVLLSLLSPTLDQSDYVVLNILLKLLNQREVKGRMFIRQLEASGSCEQHVMLALYQICCHSILWTKYKLLIMRYLLISTVFSQVGSYTFKFY